VRPLACKGRRWLSGVEKEGRRRRLALLREMDWVRLAGVDMLAATLSHFGVLRRLSADHARYGVYRCRNPHGDGIEGVFENCFMCKL